MNRDCLLRSFLCPRYRMVRGHIALVMSVRPVRNVRASRFDSVVMTKFLLAAVTSVSLLGIFSYLAHVFLTSSSFTLHKILHPSWSPRSRVVHLYLAFSSCDQVSPGHYNFRFPSCNLFIFISSNQPVLTVHIPFYACSFTKTKSKNVPG